MTETVLALREALSLRMSDAVRLTVEDDGPGLPADALERVFDRFYRVDAARSRAQGGTGLGLTIVRHITQAHDGRVWAENRPEGGARFTIVLPARSPEPVHADLGEAQEAPASAAATDARIA